MFLLGAFYTNDGIGLLVGYKENEKEKVKDLDILFKRKQIELEFSLPEEGKYIVVDFKKIVKYVFDDEILRHLSENNKIHIFLLNVDEEIISKKVYTFEIDKKFVTKLEGMLDLINAKTDVISLNISNLESKNKIESNKLHFKWLLQFFYKFIYLKLFCESF